MTFAPRRAALSPTGTAARRLRPVALAATAASALAAGVLPATGAGAASVDSQPYQHIQLLSINDLHGNLEPPGGSSGRIQTGVDAKGAPVFVPAGGAAYLATHLARLRQGQRDTITVAAGDNIGASPLLSAAFHDEPTIQALNAMGVEVSAVGNHEFDEGSAELLRMQEGGCLRDGTGKDNQDSCADKEHGGKRFRGADFDYLSANVIVTKTGEPLLAATSIEKFHGGAKIGFIGVVTRTTPTIVTASGVAGLRFEDEADVINSYAARLQAQGVQAIVALIHEGGSQTGLYDECKGLSDPITTINSRVSPAVDVLVTGHSHVGYDCRLTDPAGQPRLVTQAANYGRLITDFDLVIDRSTGDIDRGRTTATNIINTQDVPKDPAVQGIIDRYHDYLGPIESKQLGYVAGDLPRATSPAGESPLGDVVADSVTADPTVATKGAIDVGFINPGGLRADLLPGAGGLVTYGAAFSVLPFSNYNVSKTLTGAQLKAVLEQQFDNPLPGQQRILGVSGLTYTWSRSAPTGSKVRDVVVGGKRLDPAATYRVAGNSFLLEGGDGFTTFAQGTDPVYGGIDIDAFAAYLTGRSSASSPLPVPPLDRITVVA